MQRIRDFLFTIPFLVAFCLTMIVFDVLLRICLLFGDRAHDSCGRALQIVLIWCLRIPNIRLVIERSPKIRDGESYIIVSNHQGIYDIPIFGYVFFRNSPKYISKVELSRRIPAVSFYLRHGGHALIDRKNRNSAIEEIQKLGERMRATGCSAVIFAEGTRARHGEIGAFKPAGTLALLAQMPTTPVVPVCLDNSWRIVRHNMWPVPYGIEVRVWVGDPIHRLPDEDPFELFQRVEHEIRSAMDRLRSRTSDYFVATGLTGLPTPPTMG